jgi:hypothetical protein
MNVATSNAQRRTSNIELKRRQRPAAYVPQSRDYGVPGRTERRSQVQLGNEGEDGGLRVEDGGCSFSDLANW